MTERANDHLGSPEDPATSGDQSELDLGVMATGDDVVDLAVSGLAQLSSRPVSEHPAVFEEVHRGLAQAMSRGSVEPDDVASGSTDL